MAGRARGGADDLGAAAAAPARQDHAQKRSLIAAERDEAKRAAWRAAAVDLDPAALVFLDESGTHVAMTPRYARAPRGQRAYGRAPHNRGDNVTLVATLTPAGPGPAMTLAGALDGPAFGAYVRECLAPALRPGQIVVLDNLAVHKNAAARRLIEARGCRLLFLPPYSPDYNPIELAFAKLKAALRRSAARTRADRERAIALALDRLAPAETRSWFRRCGFPLTEAQPLR
ncbi:MAG TPA: IS630 family transposase [Thermomicrobiales bacterium]